MKKLFFTSAIMIAMLTACGPSVAELKEKANAGDNQALLQWAKTGDGEGMMALADAYFEGERLTFNSDSALILIQEAAEKKYPQAMSRLADYYYDGQWVEQDPQKATALYTELADLGDAYAQYMAGGCYLTGYGVEQNQSKGLTLIEKAIAQGNDDAKDYLASAYLNGNGVDVDTDKALKLYRQLAEGGSANAMCSVGHILLTYYPSDENDKEAFAIMEKGADLGSDGCMYNLGWCAETGRGTEKNIEVAKEYYVKAKDLGSNLAVQALQRLTPKQFNIAGHKYQGKTKHSMSYGGTDNCVLDFGYGGSYWAVYHNGYQPQNEKGVWRQNGNTVEMIRSDGSRGKLTIKDNGNTITGNIDEYQGGTLTLVK